MTQKHHNKISQRTRDLIETGRKYFVPNYKQRDMILDHGKGSRLWDIDGNEYIDLGSGIAVNSLGHQDPDLVKAVEQQAHKLWHTSNVFFSEPAILLAEALVQSAPFAKRAFFCNSGAEANEGAIKLVRKYAAEKLGRPPEKREIITFTGSFHGRTLAATTATAQPKYQQGYEPLPAGFVYCTPFNDAAALEKLVSDKTCAIMLEPIQGEGGIVPAKPGFLKKVRELCDKVGALLVYDEVQCGMGRTGMLYGYQHDGVEPDVMTLAKALGGGLPIGAMLVGEKAAEIFQFGSHGNTFGGNPIATTVARVALHKLQSKDVVNNVKAREKQLRDALAAIDKDLGIFTEVRGRGLMIGAELKEHLHGKAGDILEAARAYGALVLQAGPNVLRFLPPLTITEEELATGMSRLHEALREFTQSLKAAS